MNQTTDEKNERNKYWIEINDVQKSNTRFQYFVDAKIKLLTSTPQKLFQATMNIFQILYIQFNFYPENLTHHAVSVVKTQQDEYVWESNDFQVPDSRDLVIYELLIRDFSYRSDYQTV